MPKRSCSWSSNAYWVMCDEIMTNSV